MQANRYRFYREHKYVSFILTELEREMAQCDFTSACAIATVNEKLVFTHELMKAHGEHENRTLHALLRNKGSHVYEQIEADHIAHEKQFENLLQQLADIADCKIPQTQIELGYALFLQYRLFVSENLRHLHEEETVIMAELQRLYSDDELRAVPFHTYDQMTPQQMLHMTQVLFPHMNKHDKEVFLRDLQEAQSEKFEEIAELLS